MVYGEYIKVFLVHAMKVHGGGEVELHSVLISTLDGKEWSAPRLNRFNHGERIPVRAE
jgi:hypothetical protein